MEFKQKLALPMDDFDVNDFDPNFEPQNGEDYLKKVIFERKNIPEIVTKSLPDHIQNSCTTVQEEQETKIPPSQQIQELIPTAEWQRLQVEIFTQTRHKVSKMRSKDYQTLSNIKSSNLRAKVNDEDEAIKYCQENEPFLSTILDLGQRNLELLVSHFACYIEEQCENQEFLNEISTSTDESPSKYNWLSKWIYASLLCLQKPLEGHIIADLRLIAKSCIKIRSNMEVSDMIKTNVIPFNILICIIAYSFDQFDLSDDIVIYSSFVKLIK